MHVLFVILILLAAFLAGCDATVSTVSSVKDDFGRPPSHMPPMPTPADNPVTLNKAMLGRRLFYDARLSRNGTIACATCHRPESSFSDAPRQVSQGIDGNQGNRNSPSIINAGYRRFLFWDGRAATLEDQAMAAFLNPIEMAADTVAVARLLRSAEYAADWQKAFNDTVVTMRRVMQAIATFERTIISADSPYDRFRRGDSMALNAMERWGMQLFFSDRTRCASCHSGPDLTDDSFHSVGLFHHYFDRGRYEVTRDPQDEGRFKTPMLRNVALTPPYMATGDSEDGILETLEDVIEHYNKGGSAFNNKDKRVGKLNLTEQEKSALVAFLRALTDSSVLRNPLYLQP